MMTLMTVRGPISPEACGIILPHEHLFVDLRNQAAPGAERRKVTADDHARLMCDPYCMTDNLLLGDFDVAAAECRELLSYSCSTVVDCSPPQIGRDPQLLRKLAENTGVNIIMGCGYYTADTHPALIRKLSSAQIAEELIREIENGVGDTGIRPGIIGEIGTSKAIEESERKMLEAAALTQVHSGLAVQIHVYPWSSNGLEVVKILTGKGVAPDRIVICHSDVQPDWPYISQLLKEGVWVELDNFGKEFIPKSGGFADGIFISDTERTALAGRIIDSGYGGQLLLSNDVCLKCMLLSCGGQGYRHLFRNILPLLVRTGIPEKYLRDTICRANPLAMICGKHPVHPFSHTILPLPLEKVF